MGFFHQKFKLFGNNPPQKENEIIFFIIIAILISVGLYILSFYF